MLAFQNRPSILPLPLPFYFLFTQHVIHQTVYSTQQPTKTLESPLSFAVYTLSIFTPSSRNLIHHHRIPIPALKLP